MGRVKPALFYEVDMDYAFENLINSKNGKPIVIKDVTPEMLKGMEIARQKGKEAAERMKAFFSKD